MGSSDVANKHNKNVLILIDAWPSYAVPYVQPPVVYNEVIVLFLPLSSAGRAVRLLLLSRSGALPPSVAVNVLCYEHYFLDDDRRERISTSEVQFRPIPGTDKDTTV